MNPLRASSALVFVTVLSIGAGAARADPTPINADPTSVKKDDGPRKCGVREAGERTKDGEREAGAWTEFMIVVRADFNDFGSDCPKETRLQAVGAQVSYAHNELTHQDQASLDGVVAVFKRYYPHSASYGFVDAGPYVQGDGAYQFESAKSPASAIHTVTAGGFVQIGGLHDPFGASDANGASFGYIRLRAGYTFGSTGTGSTTMAAEWFPKVDNSALRLNEKGTGDNYTYTIIAEMEAQYDALDNGPDKYRLFLTKHEALRLGPQLGLKFSGPEDSRYSTIQPAWLQALAADTSLSVSYHAATDVYAGRGYSWASETLTITPAQSDGSPGHFGFSQSFGDGYSEATGNKSCQLKFGVAVKF